MRTARLAIALVALWGSSACTDEPSPPAVPSSAFPTATPERPIPTGPTGTTGEPTGPTGVLPTTSPGAGTGNLTSGQLSFQMSGDVEAEATIRTLVTAVYTPPPGGLAIVWTAGGTDPTTVGIGGSSFVGTQPTSTTLTLTITASSADGFESFLSMDGECEVTISAAGQRELAGGFSCRGLESPTGRVVDVSGSFRATG